MERKANGVCHPLPVVPTVRLDDPTMGPGQEDSLHCFMGLQ